MFHYGEVLYSNSWLVICRLVDIVCQLAGFALDRSTAAMTLFDSSVSAMASLKLNRSDGSLQKIRSQLGVSVKCVYPDGRLSEILTCVLPKRFSHCMIVCVPVCVCTCLHACVHEFVHVHACVLAHACQTRPLLFTSLLFMSVHGDTQTNWVTFAAFALVGGSPHLATCICLVDDGHLITCLWVKW